MIELNENDLKSFENHSSKGNQLKWSTEGYWYKADYTGYEGLAEYVVSRLIEKSSLGDDEIALYSTEQIKYKHRILNGAKSKDFLAEGWQIITLSRLYQTKYNRDFTRDVWHISDEKSRLEFLVDQIIKITSLDDFGIYMNKILTIDALFLNEDRHLHNIGVLLGPNGEFDYCPIFDHGAALLADTTIDYPLDVDIYTLIDEVRAKTITPGFSTALDVSEELFGENIKFYFTHKDVENLISNINTYEPRILKRVETVIFEQRRKYKYLFSSI